MKKFTLLTLVIPCFAFANVNEITLEEQLNSIRNNQGSFNEQIKNLENSDIQINKNVSNENITLNDNLLNSNQKDQLSVASQNKGSDDCAIWLCLPVGFAHETCNDPHRAFLRRIRQHKSPLPPFSDCKSKSSLSSNDDFSSKNGVSAYLPKRTVQTEKCIEQSYAVDHYGRRPCTKYEYKTLPETHIKGTPCLHTGNGNTNPKGCTETHNYIEVLINGNKYGDTYYYN